jgi:hypothetical protein
VTDPQELTAAQFAQWWKETGERELRQILFWRWDPLAISGYFPNTADEYDGYLPGVVALLRLGVDEGVLAEHLEFLEREPMGLMTGDGERRAAAAALLTEWFANSVGSWSRFGPS